MTATDPKVKPPRLNHVAMSIPAELLGEEGRRDIVDFYATVFGWEELPTETVDGKKLVLSAYRYDQFIFLIADDPPMQCPRLDHFGMGVDTEEQLDEFLARAKAYKEKDDRVDLIDKSADVHPGITITSFYVGFLLPMMVEVQYWDFTGR